MPSLNLKPRDAWSDRFRAPTTDELKAALGKQPAHLLEATRNRLLDFPNVREELSWQGIPWRWSFVYRWEAEPDRAWAYVIPEPGKPRLALPLNAELITRLPARKLSKPVRDGIVQATEVAQVRWAQWELTSKTLLDELLIIAGLKHEALTAQA